MHEVNVAATELARSARRLLKKPKFQVSVLILLALVLLAVTVYRYSPKDHTEDCAFRIASSGQPITEGDSFRVDTCVTLEVAATNSARTLGLSNRTSMPMDRGMLFDFGTTGEYCMWMKDMHFSIDIIWLGEDKEILHMAKAVAPETFPTAFCGPHEARYVIEVNSGVIAAGDLHIGQRLHF